MRTSTFYFIWHDLRDWPQVHPIDNARFAVGFTINTSPGLEVFALAYMLLRFCEQNTRDGDYHLFKIVDLTYHVEAGTVRGMCFFDNLFRAAFSRAVHSSILIMNGFFPNADDKKCPFELWFTSPGTSTHNVPTANIQTDAHICR